MNFTASAPYLQRIYPRNRYKETMLPALTMCSDFATLWRMSKTIRKVVALLMLLWLPISGGSAMAASLAMQLQQGECGAAHESHAMAMHEGMDHQHMMHHDQPPQSADDDSNCNGCGVCHLACSGYFAAPAMALSVLATGSQPVVAESVRFTSHITTPLVPPPLAAA